MKQHEQYKFQGGEGGGGGGGGGWGGILKSSYMGRLRPRVSKPLPFRIPLLIHYHHILVSTLSQTYQETTSGFFCSPLLYYFSFDPHLRLL